MTSRFSILILLTIFITACGAAPAEGPGTVQPTVDLVSTIVAATLTAQPVITLTRVPSLTPAPAPTQAVHYIFTSAQNVNLRTGPGTLFRVSRVMPQGTRLQLLGIEQTSLWLSVMNDEGIQGWVDGRLVEGWHEVVIPVIEPEHVQVVRGRVLDGSGAPLKGIGFAVYQGNVSRTDAVTDDSGFFYAYLPPTARGTWNVEFVSVACPSAVLQPPCDCQNNSCGHPVPEIQSIILPINDLLTFTWVD